MSDNENKLYNLNITFKYEYFDKKLQKEVKYDYTILENGKFLHSDIRNQNFYDNIIDNYTEVKQCENKGQSCDKIKPAIEKADNKDNRMNLAIPFSNKYIDLNILDKIIINEGKDKSKNEKLGFNNLVRELKDNTGGSYNITNYIYFIDDILSLFTGDRKDLLDYKTKIEIIKEKDNTKELIKYINTEDAKVAKKEAAEAAKGATKEATEADAGKPAQADDTTKERDNISYPNIYIILNYLQSNLKLTPRSDLSNKSNKFYTKFIELKNEKDKQNQKDDNIFEEFKNKNFMKLFDTKNLEGRQITKLFDILDEDFDKVSTFNKELYSYSTPNRADTDEYNSKKPKYYNNKEKLESIIYDYAQYIDKDIYNKLKKNKKDLINHITQRIKPFKQIITYYNIFKLLTELYIIKDTIIFNTNLKGSHYKKILKIEPMIQLKLKPLFRGDNINFIYSVTFEEIPETSLLRFNINIINNDEKLISKDEDEDSYNEKYIPYSTSIYSQKNDLNEYIIYNHKLDVKKIISQFPFLIQNDDLFKKVKPNNVNEIFLNNQLFEHINKPKFIDSSKKEDIEHGKDIEHYIRDNYINELFFKKNNILFLNKKFYQITEAKINETITKQRKKNKTNIINKEADDKIVKKGYYLAYNNIDNRLAYNGVGSTLNFYLDVYCYVKNKIDEKISFNKKFESFFNCNNSANNLDILFKDLLQEYYSENTFKNLLKNNKNIDEVPPIDKAPLINEAPEKQKQYMKPKDELKKFDDKMDFDDDKMDFEKKIDYGGKKLIKKKEKKDNKLIIKKNKKIKKKKIFSKMYYNNKNNNNKKFKKYTSKYHKNKRKINLKTKTIKLIKYYLNY